MQLHIPIKINFIHCPQVPRESFKHIVKACECPLYWKMPLFLATQQNLHLPVDGHKFIDYWRE